MYNIFRIIIYFFLNILSCFILSNSINHHHNIESQKNKSIKISVLQILFISTLFSCFSVIASSNPLSMDRLNYAVWFENYYTDSWSIGLTLVSNFLYIFTDNANFLFFFISFLYTFTTLFACRYLDNLGRNTIMLLFFSDYMLFGFYLLKQAPAIAFGNLALILMIKNKRMYALLFLACSVFFHESAFILIPLLTIIVFEKSKIIKCISYLTLVLLALNINIFNSYILSSLSNYIPSLLDELTIYLNSQGELIQNTSFSLNILKGFPYYWITINALINKSYLKYKINRFDSYLFISFFVSCMYIFSGYMYWLFRLGLYGVFLTLFFADQIYLNLRDRKTKLFFMLPLLLSLSYLTYRYLFQIFILNGGF